MATLSLTLRVLTENIFDEAVDGVFLKTELGEMEILPGHATLVGIVGFSRVIVRQGSRQTVFVMRQGSVHVEGNQVRILAQDAQKEETLSIDSVRAYLEYIEKMAREKEKLSAYQQAFLQEQRDILEESLKQIQR